VDEQETPGCPNPQQTATFVKHKDSPRKVRLLACAHYREKWEAFTDERLRTAIEVAERYADGQATPDELAAARAAAWAIVIAEPWGKLCSAACSAHVATKSDETMPDCVGLFIVTRIVQHPFLRDILTTPSHPRAVDPAWLSWQDGLVRRLAEAAYQKRYMPSGTLDPARLAVLADALEEAGCDNADILGHLRGPGPHVRGCWPVDLLLGKS
jgi:hypothetical protein